MRQFLRNPTSLGVTFVTVSNYLLGLTLTSAMNSPSRRPNSPPTRKMASLQVSQSCLALVPISQSSFRRKSNWVLKLRGCRRLSYSVTSRFRVLCRAQEDNNTQSSGEEPPESLFMKELKRRGMSPTSLLEETDRGSYAVDDEIRVKEDGSFFNRNAVSTEIGKSLANQRERSMTLNSEGLEGLIPRAKVLLTIGGTYFLGFGPLILITVAFFCAVYLYFGQSFIHDGSDVPISPSQFVDLDPYTLLEDERISLMESRLN